MWLNDALGYSVEDGEYLEVLGLVFKHMIVLYEHVLYYITWWRDMVRLEEVIGETMPGCGLKASPHIDSRLKKLVSKFRAIVLFKCLEQVDSSGMIKGTWFRWRDLYMMNTARYGPWPLNHPVFFFFIFCIMKFLLLFI